MTRFPFGCILFTSSVAFAAETAKPVVAVVGVHQPALDAGAQELLHARIVELIDGSSNLDALPAADVATAIAGRESVIVGDALLGEGRRFLADGTNLYNQALPEDAIPLLEKAIESLGFGLAASNTTQSLWEAWMTLGTCHAALDRSAEAQAAWQHAVALNPSRSPNPAQYPPDVVQGFAAARALLAPNTRTLHVDAADNAIVWVDGEARGPAPVELEGLLQGTHHVVARGGGKSGYAAVDLQPGTVPFDLKVSMGAPSLGGASATPTGRSRQTSWLYRSFGAHAQGVDYVLLAGTDNNELFLQLYAPKTEAFSTAVKVPVSGDADDELLASLPQLLSLVDAQGSLGENVIATVAPLSVGANSYLAALLLDPRPAVMALGAGEPPRRRGGLVAAVAGGAGGLALIAGGVAAAVVLGGSTVPPDGGTIVVGPF